MILFLAGVGLGGILNLVVHVVCSVAGVLSRPPTDEEIEQMFARQHAAKILRSADRRWNIHEGGE